MTIDPTERVLDWVPRHDPASRRYGIAEIVRTVEPAKKFWNPGLVLDQGREGACVGFAWAGELAASPKRISSKVTTSQLEDYALGIYREAQRIDEWEGEAYDGTSVLAGAKVLRSRAFMDSYRWCFSIEDVRSAVIAEGPVVIGIPWLDSMYWTRPSGLVEVNGNLVGGHAILLTGYHPNIRLGKEGYSKRFEVFRWRNSWGLEYGVRGSGYVTAEDLEYLLTHQGEACVLTGRKTTTLK